jgi:hypothetical protein
MSEEKTLPIQSQRTMGGNWFILIGVFPAIALLLCAMGVLLYQFFLAPPLLPQPPSSRLDTRVERRFLSCPSST